MYKYRRNFGNLSFIHRWIRESVLSDFYQVENQKYQIVRCQYDDILFDQEVYELRECEGNSDDHQGENALINRLGGLDFVHLEEAIIKE